MTEIITEIADQVRSNPAYYEIFMAYMDTGHDAYTADRMARKDVQLGRPSQVPSRKESVKQ